ncbi:MAG TPA: glycoside hydrolase family 9 protein [Polyangia bacterium]|nr:glycoside hydrolase family 9 protein [Polyangia bacterium]
MQDLLKLRSSSGPAAFAPMVLAAVTLVTLAWPVAGCSVFFPSAPDPPKPPSDAHVILLNSIGFLPDAAKQATVLAPGGATLEIHHAADGSLAWTGDMPVAITDDLTGDPLFRADFSAFTDVGEFYLEVPGLGKSATFKISPDVYNDLLNRSMMGMYGQRCGTAVSLTLNGETWSHPACHLKDGSLKYLTGVDEVRASTGGWHDAGDYGKYTTNGAFSAGMMLAAWEQFQPALTNLALPIPEQGGAIPDFLDEVKWEVDWLLTLPSPDGGVPHKLTALAFEGFLMPEDDASPRYFTLVGTAATADFVAVTAAAARIYRPYDATFADTCLAAARLSYGYLQSNTGPAVPDTSAFGTGGYGDRIDADERVWAAAELWETTGEAAFLSDFETRAANATVDANFDWQNVGNLGLFRYLLSKREGRNPDLVSKLQASLIKSANDLRTRAGASSWGRAISYWWGANGAVARTAMNLATANALSPDSKYRDAIVSALDHLLGRNHYDRSQVTMVGYYPPLHPHHRPSAADRLADPWPGLLVGGQDCPSGAANCASAPKYDWDDVQAAANLNEIAINWNGALVYAAAALAH